MSQETKSKIELKILASEIDQTTKVRLFQIIDRGPSDTETFLIDQLLRADERYKKSELPVDTRIKEEFNQP